MKNEHGILFIQIWVSVCHFECELYIGGFIELLPFVPRKIPSRLETPKHLDEQMRHKMLPINSALKSSLLGIINITVISHPFL
jgi:hypothetical protein